jgi:hypothetical protein
VEIGDAGVGAAEGIIEGNGGHGTILDFLQAAGDFVFPFRGQGGMGLRNGSCRTPILRGERD